ncbi:peptidase C65 Otubain-domain-containing protein [Pterulicium gracile]|uniref:ubiquitinyl hydrolase 1 n=1 Tax=Pterulicium gracile TaxID=1884261 RepID=A0A5C3Q735_9AGAR|nr:peptidase C65 Otubain-domain-containing protein [Pterula gracilis]
MTEPQQPAESRDAQNDDSRSEAPTSTAPVQITPETDISTLSAAQLYDLNQEFLNDSVPTRPLVDTLVPMSVLREEYENGSGLFLQQIDELVEKGFKSIHRTRGDGDCFYRSLAFAYVSQLLASPDQAMSIATSLSLIESTSDLLDMAGFQKMVYEDFMESLTDIIKNVVGPDASGKKLDQETLLTKFQDAETSNYVVVYLRLLTSAQIRADPDTYSPFLFHPEAGVELEPREFCEAFVEATGREADHVQITALSRALQTNVKIAYLDGRSEKAEFVDFTNAVEPEMAPIHLLYRPGHYDILVPA